MFLENFSVTIALLLSIPLLVVALQCLVVLFFHAGNPPATTGHSRKITYKILIPAHNEAAVIANTLTKLLPALPEKNSQNIVLVADNCSDTTADIARTFGIVVLERRDLTKRGKGYALDFGIQYLQKADIPDVVVILDADCDTDNASLNSLINTAAIKNRPAQMIYLMRVAKDAGIKQKIAGFAWLVKNKIRLLAMNRLGFPALLTGTGMAFPWQVLEIVKLGHGNIVEDMQLAIDCAVYGFPPVLCPEALVYSDFPDQSQAELSQRTRWEHGHLQTIVQQVPFLAGQAVKKWDLRLFALAADIGVPPLSLLIMIALGGLAVLTILAMLMGIHTGLWLLGLSFGFFALMLTGIWLRYGRDYLSLKELLGIPVYILSKLTIYLNFIFNRQKEWVKTKRDV
jgi:cellulose synthase/poly-beta-1,6-N-acetylglucosamine synthase-like glycosyltransferase